MTPVKTFQIPPIIITGAGASEIVGEQSLKLGVEKCLIVTDKILVELGTLDTIKRAFGQSKIQFAIYDEVSTEPTMEHVEQGLKVYKENTCDFLVAVGGYSTEGVVGN